MLDFQAVRDELQTLPELAAPLSRDDLGRASRAMTDAFLQRIEGCADGDVTFQPVDPEAHDAFAADPSEEALPWTLAHVIVHVTASAEEAAFLAAEMARGVAPHGRSRYEVPWQQITTLAGCRQRLQESRRMALASLGIWPDEPHLEVTAEGPRGGPPRNAVARFLAGLMHSDAHLDQVAEIVRQAHDRDAATPWRERRARR